MSSRNINLTNAGRKRLAYLMRALVEQQVPVSSLSAMWSNGNGVLSIGLVGYATLSNIAAELQSVPKWHTCPVDFLMTIAAHAFLDHRGDAQQSIEQIEQKLNDNVGLQRAFVPFFGFHLEDGLILDFGKYRLQQLGAAGFHSEIIQPLRHIRRTLGEEQIADDIAVITQTFKYTPNVPILTTNYDGSREGATVIVRQIAENVAAFMQLIAAWSVRGREHVKVIDHRGAYVGQFSNFMPVLSLDTESLEPLALGTPNLLENPHGPVITAKDIEYLKTTGLLDLLPEVPSGPTKGESVTAILLRASQLIADGERGVSIRQAIISYIGACDAMFGKSDASELYTCAGIAAASGEDFDSAFAQAKLLYEARSVAAHDGISPETLGPARSIALTCIQFLANRKTVLKNKAAIREWIAPFVERAINSKPGVSS
jgi:hypothetical protein